MTWATLILKYLSYLDVTLTKRDLNFWKESVEELKKSNEEEILELVQEFNAVHLHHFPPSLIEQEQLETFRSKATVLSHKLKGENRGFESLICELLAVDLASPLPSAFRRFDTAQWREAMEEGLEMCEQAIEIISKLKKIKGADKTTLICCEAFYCGQQGEVYFYCRQIESALSVGEENLRTYDALSLTTNLEKRDEECFSSYKAITHKNISRAQRELLRYNKAREHCEKVLEFFEKWQETHGEYPAEQKAISLRNYASILRGLGDYEQAKKFCKQALEIFTHLRESTVTIHREPWENQDPYAAHIAMSLTTLASILWKFGHLSAARLRCEEGLALFLGLSAHQQRIYAPHKAMLLYTTGNILVAIEKNKNLTERNVRAFQAAKRFYVVALHVYEELSRSNEEQIFEPYKAATLRNLADTLFEIYQSDKEDIQPLEEAKKRFESAIQIYHRLLDRQKNNISLLIDIGVTQCLFGLLYESEGNSRKAQLLFAKCVENCEKGLKNLGEKEHYALHKSKIEAAYQRIIYKEAKSIVALSKQVESNPDAQLSVQQDADLMRRLTKLIRLLETLRQEKIISNIEDQEDTDVEDNIAKEVIIQAAQPDDDLWLQLYHPKGKIASVLEDILPEEMRPAAFLWIHSTPEGVVCVVLKAGAFVVEIASPMLAAYLELLSKQVNLSWENFFKKLDPADIKFSKYEAGSSLVHWGRLIFQHLPSRIKQFLEDKECSTLFISPCAKTINVPFEIIHVPSFLSNESQNNLDDRFLGLRLLMPRIHSLGDLESLLTKPVSSIDDVRGEVLLVGNPEHSPERDQSPKKFVSLKKAQILAKRFGRGFISLQNRGEISSSLQLAHAHPLTATNAVKSNIINCLEAGQLRFWWHMGHGVGPESAQDERRGPQVEYLALAEQGKLYAHEILGRNLEGAIVHFDCCEAGTVRSIGGGRFQSLPSAALAAGAITVLSSPFPMWEKEAVEFSFRLYARATSGTMSLGQALLKTRRQLAREHKNNPLIWAPLVLWGNPYIHLSRPASQNVIETIKKETT